MSGAPSADPLSVPGLAPNAPLAHALVLVGALYRAGAISFADRGLLKELILSAPAAAARAPQRPTRMCSPPSTYLHSTRMRLSSCTSCSSVQRRSDTWQRVCAWQRALARAPRMFEPEVDVSDDDADSAFAPAE